MNDPIDRRRGGLATAVHRSVDRRYTRVRNQQNWLTFDLDGSAEPVDCGCEALENIGENWWGPQASARVSARHEPADVITYVRAGRLHRSDSAGRGRVLEAGDFERSSAGPEDGCVDTNPSKTHFCHVFRIFLRPQVLRMERPPETKRFSETDRKGRMLVVASRDGEDSLCIDQDARIFSTLLYPGQHVMQSVGTHRAVWLHVAQGAVSVGDHVLGKGDSVGVRSVELTIAAREHSEVLVVECVRSSFVSGRASDPVLGGEGWR